MSTSTRRPRGRPSTAGGNVKYGSSTRWQRSRRSKPANPKNMRKTTQRGAYAKSKKRQMVIRRAPIVETYKYQTCTDDVPSVVQHQFLDIADPFNVVPVDSFLAGFKQSLDIPRDGVSTSANVGPTCKGRDIFSKLIGMKLKFEFPENDSLIRSNYVAPIVYHGWIKKTLFQTTNPTRDIIIAQVAQVLEKHFNDKASKLEYMDKQPSEFIILGKRKIRPNLNTAIAPKPTYHTNDDGTVDHYRGALPPVFHKMKWYVNRKIGLKQTNSWLTGGGEDESRFVPGDSWLPFCIVYNSDHEKQTLVGGNAGQIKVEFNSVHYYSDS